MDISCQSFINNFLPQDAYLLRKLYRENGELSQEIGWKKIHTSVLIPRLLRGPLTVPVAVVTTGSYALRGVFKMGIEVINCNFKEALKALAQDLLSAMKCAALIVHSIAYATLGLFFGSVIYSQFIPQPIPPTVDKEKFLQDQIDSLTKQKQVANDDLAKRKTTIQAYESQIKEQNTKIERLVRKHQTNIQDKDDQIKAKNIEITEKDKKIRDLVQEQLKNLANVQEIHQKCDDLEVKYKATYENLLKQNEAAEQENTRLIETYKEDIEKFKELYQEHLKLANGYAELALANSELQKQSKNSEDLTKSTLELVDEFCNEGLIEPCLDTVPSSPSPASYIMYDYAMQFINTFNLIIQPAQKIAFDWFVDGKDPWKDQRFVIGLEQLQKTFGAQEIEALKQLQQLPGAKGMEVLFHLKEALVHLTKPILCNNVREQRKDFMISMRKALLILQHDANHGIPQDIQDRINALCEKWITAVEMNPYNFQIALYVAAQGDPKIIEKIEDDESTLHQILGGTLKGIKDAPPEFKAPIMDLIGAKWNVVWDYYDPALLGNISSKVANYVYRDQDGNQKVVQEFRTCVPITQRSTPKGSDKAWEQGEIALTPEHVGLLNALKAKNKLIDQKAALLHGEEKAKLLQTKEKLLIVLHLNPRHYNAETSQLEGLPSNPALHKAFMRTLPAREALWIKLIRDVSLNNEFSDVMSVAVVPMDGTWLKHDIIECKERMSLSQCENHLFNVLMGEKSPYIMPPSITKEQKEMFVRSILEKTKESYFTQDILGKTVEDYTLDKHDMLAFVGIFDSFLIEALQLKENATIVQRDCKDGVDRTGALVGAELIERNYRLNNLDNKDTIKKIVGETCGPALGNLKRELLEDRQPLLLGTAAYIDKLRKHNIAIKKPSYDGYYLEGVEMGEDTTQNLYPHLSNAASEEEYRKYIEVELKYPFATPKIYALKPISNEEKKKKLDRDVIFNLLNEIQGILQHHYANTTLNHHVIPKEKKDNMKSSLIKDEVKVSRTYLISKTNIKLNVEVTVNLSIDPAVPQFKYEMIE